MTDLVCRFCLLSDGKPCPFSVEVDPFELRLVSESGTLGICFGDAETLLFHSDSSRLGLRLDFSAAEKFPPYGFNFPFGGRNLWMENGYRNHCKLLLDVRSGTRTGTTILDFRPGRDGLFLSLRQVLTEWDRILPDWDFAAARVHCRKAFGSFLDRLPPAPPDLQASREFAAYILWSCCVRPAGFLRTETMLMSKAWMTKVWSWDHCFNAIALAGSHPDMAWEQFIGIFGHQDASGVLPDCISDGDVLYSFCKPPIHGWALSRMMRRMRLSTEQMETAYGTLSRWTDWWLHFRDRDGNGLCEYDHGNDSGWDNASPFAFPPPVELPDLQAFLVLQMETLADLATRLGRESEAANWTARGKSLLERMCRLCFDADGRPLARKAFTGETASPDSLILRLPVLLGKRLPDPIRRTLLRDLKGDLFLTPWGYATESPRSPRYVPDGYWLGPIWAPPTLLLMDGLRACGEEALARDVGKRFLRLFAKGGSSENYDALTGEGLRDHAYTWSAAVFLTILADD